MARLTAVRDDCEHGAAAQEDVDARNEALIRYTPLVRFVAKRVASSFGIPTGMEIGDLVSHGLLGLIEAFERYEQTRGVSFETFAIPRIRGAILDELRRSDWVPRNVRARARRLNDTRTVLTAEFGRAPTRTEIAESLGVEQLDAFERSSRPATLLGLEEIVHFDAGGGEPVAISDTLFDPDAEVPGSALEDAERKASLVAALGEIGERDRLIITLYYFENLQLGEIARLLNVTESRVSQLHTRALHALHARLRDV